MQNSDSNNTRSHKKHIRRILVAGFAFFALTTTLIIYTAFKLSSTPEPLTYAQEALARSVYQRESLNEIHPYRGAPELSPWNWTGSFTLPEEANLKARSIILVSADTGEILFERNADERIPPASMTKLVAIYTALHAVANGEVHLDDNVYLPEASWAQNIPPGSSLMFLGPGQRVTLDELITGMAVVSGNDAAIALAHHISGSVPAFIERMNKDIRNLGLEQTVFVEPSGLSDNNLTTAREFASFALRYIREFPDALERYHSKKDFSYPRSGNLLPGHLEPSIYQRATNTMLASLPGCDGLKTGFIYASGFNICLTVERKGVRYIAVLMGGPGNTIREGVKIRESDGTFLMNWVFANRSVLPTKECTPAPIIVWGGQESALRAIPAGTGFIITPDGAELTTRTFVPNTITAPISAGIRVGTITYYLNGSPVHQVPLVADRTIGKAHLPFNLIDRIAAVCAELLLPSAPHSE